MQQLLKQVLNWQNHIQRLILPLALIILTTQFAVDPASAIGVDQMPRVSAGDRSWVIDQADVLSRVNEGKISNILENLANKTGKEVRIVTIRRLDYGETPESFTNDLFNNWFPSSEAQTNQALLVIDTLTNGIGIRTGEQVKTLLPDSIAQSVTSETMLAPLRNGEKYNQAFLDASDRLTAILSGEPDPGPPRIAEIPTEGTFKKAEETEAGNATVWVIGLLLAATIIPMATYYLYVR